MFFFIHLSYPNSLSFSPSHRSHLHFLPLQHLASSQQCTNKPSSSSPTANWARPLSAWPSPMNSSSDLLTTSTSPPSLPSTMPSRNSTPAPSTSSPSHPLSHLLDKPPSTQSQVSQCAKPWSRTTTLIPATRLICTEWASAPPARRTGRSCRGLSRRGLGRSIWPSIGVVWRFWESWIRRW